MIVGTVRIVRPATSLACRDKAICSFRLAHMRVSSATMCKAFIAAWLAVPLYAVLALEVLGLFQQIGEACAQLALEQLAARVLRQAVDEDHLLRHLEVRHLLATERQ